LRAAALASSIVPAAAKQKGRWITHRPLEIAAEKQAAINRL
jgi:hypothetical protein